MGVKHMDNKQLLIIVLAIIIAGLIMRVPKNSIFDKKSNTNIKYK